MSPSAQSLLQASIGGKKNFVKEANTIKDKKPKDAIDTIKSDVIKSANIEVERRDFLNLLTIATGTVGITTFVWPLVDSMNPSKDVLALATTEVDISQVPVGQAITVKWQGKPIFIRHRTVEEIEQAVSDDEVTDMPDFQKDEVRVKKSEWLILIGICTHLGCIPSGQAVGSQKGEFGGWFCPCHGSQYDTSGRIRKGPAPKNLAIPPYQFLTDTVIKIG